MSHASTRDVPVRAFHPEHLPADADEMHAALVAFYEAATARGGAFAAACVRRTTRRLPLRLRPKKKKKALGGPASPSALNPSGRVRARRRRSRKAPRRRRDRRPRPRPAASKAPRYLPGRIASPGENRRGRTRGAFWRRWTRLSRRRWRRCFARSSGTCGPRACATTSTHRTASTSRSARTTPSRRCAGTSRRSRRGG